MANDVLTLDRTVAVGVEATAKDGDVTLTGAVRCGTERAAAEAMIADLTGVRTVTDDIQIRDDANPLHATASRWNSHENLDARTVRGRRSQPGARAITHGPGTCRPWSSKCRYRIMCVIPPPRRLHPGWS